jgi:hypothetical protein
LIEERQEAEGRRQKEEKGTNQADLWAKKFKTPIIQNHQIGDFSVVFSQELRISN